jgi:hypothetical protein
MVKKALRITFTTNANAYRVDFRELQVIGFSSNFSGYQWVLGIHGPRSVRLPHNFLDTRGGTALGREAEEVVSGG